MITSKLLELKKSITNKLKDPVIDFIYSTFRFPKSNVGGSITVVGDFEDMRPDLVSERIYGEHNMWDAMLKYNGISNPFSIKKGDVLFTMPYVSLNSVYIKPRDIIEREVKTETPINGYENIDETKGKDTNRLKNLSNKKGQLPPNINKPGDKNVTIKDGKVIFGQDVTSINKTKCCNIPISRARLKKALLKDKLFI